jgi:DNA-directed RNA polymerase subunit RPC12/RpoP
MAESLVKYRCNNCGKPLFFGAIYEGTVSIDCLNSKCRHRNVFEFKAGAIKIDIPRKQICRVHADCKREGIPCKYG